MTEFYDYTDSRYYDLLKYSTRVYYWKLELLDYQDAVIKEIVIDLDTSNSGSLSFSNEQGSCRTCAFTFTNPDNKYSIIENNPFWDRRRFKIYIGVGLGEVVYWFSKGVYITQTASVDYHTITVQAVDKYGLLDGTLKVLPAFLKTTFKAGTKIGDIIRQILLQDIGNGFVLDAVEPIIDPDIANSLLYRDYEMAVGSYYGDFLSELMNGYGCDIYYDALGRLIVQRKFNDDLPYWYFYQGVSYSFSDDEIHYQEPNTNYDFDGVNFIIVETDNDDGVNASCELGNHNPQSPVCIEKIGYKAFDDGRPVYISTGDASIDAPEKKCKEYAEYMLLQQTCNTITKSFNAPIIPHLDTRQSIRITDKTTLEDGVVFLITGLTIPFGVPDNATITATNIQWLLTDVESTSLTSERHNPAAAKYTITYSGTIKNENNASVSFPSVSDFVGGAVLLPSSGKPKGLNGVDLGFFNTTNVFKGWLDNQVGLNHRTGSLYTIPEQNVGMSANWEAGKVAVMSCNIASTGDYKIKALDYLASIGTDDTPKELIYLKTVNKYLAPDHLMLTTGKTLSITGTGTYEVDYVFPAGAVTIGGLNDNTSLFDRATDIDLSGLTDMTTIAGDSFCSGLSNLETIILPENVTTINGYNAFSSCPKLESVTFPTTDCTITNAITLFANSGGSNGGIQSFTIPDNITLSFYYLGWFLNDYQLSKKLYVECDFASDSYIPPINIANTVEELYLTGQQHYANIGAMPSLTYLEIGEDVTVDSWSGFGSGATWDVKISSSTLTTMQYMFYQYNGSSIDIDAANVTTIDTSFRELGSNLTSLTIPDSVTEITNSITSTYLTDLVIGDGCETIANSCNGLTALTTLVIGSGIQSITSSFAGTTNLTELTIDSNDLTSISGSFNGNYIEELTIIPSTAGCTIDGFNGSSHLTDLTLGEGVTSITGFSGTRLATLTLPDSVTTITSGSFAGAPLTELNIGASLNTIGFLNPSFSLLLTITCSADNATFSTENNCIYSKDKSVLYFAPMTLTSLTVNSNTTTLDGYAIWATALTTLTLPASLTTITSGAVFNSQIQIGTLEIYNPTLDMTYIPYANVSKIRGYSGSTAETFAQTHNITFEIMA